MVMRCDNRISVARKKILFDELKFVAKLTIIGITTKKLIDKYTRFGTSRRYDF